MTSGAWSKSEFMQRVVLILIQRGHIPDMALKDAVELCASMEKVDGFEWGPNKPGEPATAEDLGMPAQHPL